MPPAELLWRSMVAVSTGRACARLTSKRPSCYRRPHHPGMIFVTTYGSGVVWSGTGDPPRSKTWRPPEPGHARLRSTLYQEAWTVRTYRPELRMSPSVSQTRPLVYTRLNWNFVAEWRVALAVG